MELASEIPVVLTATIKPNVTGAVAGDPVARLAEYRRVIQFCQQFAPVIFLENSAYPLEQHPEFAASPRLQVRRFPLSAQPEFGKGFQEFEMLDAWLETEPHPPARWLKITGRYQVLNLAAILDECRREPGLSMVIDQVQPRRWARTYLFCVATAWYRARLKGIYRRCDDRTGDCIEHVLFDALAPLPASQVHLFATQPRIGALAGFNGAAFPSGNFQWLVKQCLRRLNRLVDKRYQRYA